MKNNEYKKKHENVTLGTRFRWVFFWHFKGLTLDPFLFVLLIDSHSYFAG